ncbi:MAG: AraC family transcriptional regulator [Gammaproteobacteria bacterium]
MRLRKHDADELIQRVKEYLALMPHDRVGLAQTARAVGASPSSLAHAFRRLEHLSVYQYALGCRLRHAAHLLLTYEDLAQLALDVGFSSHSHFSSAFHRWAGCTPSEYRENIRRGGILPP